MAAPIAAAAGAVVKKAAVQFAKNKAVQGATNIAKVGATGGKNGQDPGKKGAFNRVLIFLLIAAIVLSTFIGGAIYGVATAVTSLSINHNNDSFCSHVGGSNPGIIDPGTSTPADGTGDPDSGGVGGGTDASIPASGSLSFPLSAGSFTTSSQYGMRTHPISGTRKLHRGVDYAAPTGTPVMSLADGVVVVQEVQAHNKGNKVVRIRHNIGGSTITTSYLHLNSFNVKAGDKVKAGQQIATVGNTGGSTGSHLHLEVWLGTAGSSSTNPVPWLTKNGVTPRGGATAPPAQVGGIYEGAVNGVNAGFAATSLGAGLTEYDICMVPMGTGMYPGSGALAPGSQGQQVVEIASRFIGLPYVLGASDPNAAFDCSGLTSYVYGQLGITLPRTSAQQRYAGRNISKAELLPGDLIWSPGHIAIYIGNGEIIDASSSIMETVRRPMWQEYEGAVEYIRVLDSNDNPQPTTGGGGGVAPQPNLPADRNANRSLAYNMMIAKGWPATEFNCLDQLWMRESTWNHLAENKSSGAYGIVQSLPGNKMASHGADWRTNPQTQIAWGLDYIKGRYGNPCGAWAHSERVNWY